jgi:nucleotidyltransferase substrate binding protein (TIGR01987 family)
MENKFINRYRTFCNCLNNLIKSQNADPEQDFVLEGTIQNFNLTFDISWKVMKDILVKKLEITNFALGSPREVLQTAFTNRLIDDDRWLEMLKIRNQLAHDYDGSLAENVFQKIVETYIILFERFRDENKKFYENWDMDEMHFE